MAAVGRTRPPEACVPVGEPASGVLVALFEEGGETRVVLTRRSRRLRAHSGQVSFPGGHMEPGEDAVTTALREANEEVGLDPRGVHVVGLLPLARAFSSGDPITPVVGSLDRRPRLEPSPAEVERVFDVPLAELAACCTLERWHAPGAAPFTMYVFALGGEVVWGATARMLADLLTLVLPAAGGAGCA